MKRVDLWEPIRHRLWCYVWHRQWWVDRRPYGVPWLSCRECGEAWQPKESRKHKEAME